MKGLKTILAGTVLAFVVMVNPFGVKANMASEASTIGLNQQVEGSISERGQVNYYQFTTGNELSSFTMNAAGISHSVKVAICDSMEKQIGYCTAYSKGASFTVKLNPNEIYYVKVSSGSKTADYSFEINDRMDNADQLVAADEIQVDTIVNADICVKTDVDWFKFTTGSQLSSYTMDASGTNGSVRVSICDEKEQQLGYCVAYQSGKAFTVKLNPNETYYVKVSSGIGNRPYSFRLTASADGADSKDTAEIIDVTQDIQADICTKHDVDWFAFETSDAANYTFSFVGIDHTAKMIVCDQKQKELLKITAGSSGKAASVYLDANTTYYITISSSFATKYSFSAVAEIIDLPTASIETISGKNGKIELTVSDVDADGYEIQYASNKKMTGAKVKKGTNTSYTISGVGKNKTYYVRVRTYQKVNGKYIYSDWSTVKKVKVKK